MSAATIPLNNQEVLLAAYEVITATTPLNNQEVLLAATQKIEAAKPREIAESSAPIQRWS